VTSMAATETTRLSSATRPAWVEILLVARVSMLSTLMPTRWLCRSCSLPST